MRVGSVRAAVVCVFVVLFVSAGSGANTSDLLLWFNSPAVQFTQSLPLGNGRLGAMVFGGVAEEKIVLNKSSLWSGSPQDADRPDAAQYLPEIRRLLLEGKNAAAEKLVYEHFTCKGPGSARGSGKDAQYGSYQTLGQLRLKFADSDQAVTNYRRELNLETATARVEYEQNGVRYTRETFVTAADQAIVVRLTANRRQSISFEALLTRSERGQVVAAGRNGLLMTGQLNNG